MVDGVQLEANHDHRGVADDDAEEHIGVDRFNPPDPVEDAYQHQCGKASERGIDQDMDTRVGSRTNWCQLQYQPEQQDDGEDVAIEGDQARPFTAELEPYVAVEELQWCEQQEQQNITCELGGIGKGDAE